MVAKEVFLFARLIPLDIGMSLYVLPATFVVYVCGLHRVAGFGLGVEAILSQDRDGHGHGYGLGRLVGWDYGVTGMQGNLGNWAKKKALGTEFLRRKKSLATTYSPTLLCAVPSAMKGLTSEFGMGSGISPSLLPPSKNWQMIDQFKFDSSLITYKKRRLRFFTLNRTLYTLTCFYF